MNLHKNKEMMNMMVRSAADYYRINQALVEKDYYVKLILNLIRKDIQYEKVIKTVERLIESSVLDD